MVELVAVSKVVAKVLVELVLVRVGDVFVEVSSMVLVSSMVTTTK